MIDLKRKADFGKCVEVSLQIFNQHFDHNIRDLLSVFPHDAKDKSGQPFWSGPKRAPYPITFNADDTVHLNFILASANLIAFNLGIEQTRDTNEIRTHLNNAKVPKYTPKKIKVLTPEEEKENAEKKARGEPVEEETVGATDDEEIAKTLMEQLSLEAKDVKPD